MIHPQFYPEFNAILFLWKNNLSVYLFYKGERWIYISKSYASLLVYFRKFSYESLNLSSKQYDLLANMYEFNIYLYTEISRRSHKLIYLTKILANEYISVCSDIFDYLGLY